MKLILSGATGHVGTEVIRQSLLNPKVTSMIALTRRPIDVSAIAAGMGIGKDVKVDKIKSVVLQDFMDYPDEVKKDLADADACIWALAITPMRSKQYPWKDVVRVSKDYCVAGMNAIAESRHAAGNATPFRFIYLSGKGISHDMARPWIMGDYLLMRADVEKQALNFASSHADAGWQTCIARPGLISGFSGAVGMMKNVAITAIGMLGGTISLKDCGAAMIEQCAEGFENEVLTNEDLVRLGRK